MSALTSQQKQNISDRLQMDGEALLDPANIQTPAGARAQVGDLWSQMLDARKRYLSVPIPTLVANTTNTIRLAFLGRTETVTDIRIGFGARPTSAAGTVLATLRQRTGAGAPVDVSVLSADLETILTANDQSFAIPLNATVANRRLSAGQMLFIDIISNNVDMVGGTGGVLTIELEPTEA